ncbi:hypothetical protein JKP88DRAFT_331191 [Tribonema minus]|uniref:Uncharacterized protein n=1 Tax=Tribonema minus TaxID=303371 RepID=A0A836CAD8_9STRA|nr:hypothetical protein JKP88DRAFT_331191 [Tribonema minus]
MEALVNSAYDRISEDIILLYDAFQAYEEASPRPPLSALLEAIRQVLKEEDKGRKAWSVWSSISREDLRALGGARMGQSVTHSFTALSHLAQVAAGAADTADVDGDGPDKTDAETDAEVLESTESGLREVVRVVLTSVLSDLAVLPFWTVKVSAVAARGRLPELWPFQGYRVAFAAIAREEGWAGLFRGAAPICAGGILRYLRRNRRLYSDYYWKTTQRLTARLVIKDRSARAEMAVHAALALDPEMAVHAYEGVLGRAVCSDRSARALDPEMAVHAYEGVLSRAVWAVALHPFDLLATRMITEAGARYATVRAALRTAAGSEACARYATVRAAGDGHWAGLFAGVRSSIIGACLPCSSWYALGVPFLVKTRRMASASVGSDLEPGLGFGLQVRSGTETIATGTLSVSPAFCALTWPAIHTSYHMAHAFRTARTPPHAAALCILAPLRGAHLSTTAAAAVMMHAATLRIRVPLRAASPSALPPLITSVISLCVVMLSASAAQLHDMDTQYRCVTHCTLGCT